MQINKTGWVPSVILILAIVLSISSPAVMAASVPISFTILHTNDFHGQLEASGSNPGAARMASFINGVRTAVGASKVLLVDAGDEMQGSLLSNLGDGTAMGKGIPTIAAFNAMGYNVATFGNHEFDWGQINLGNRTAQATYPFVTANIVKNDTGECATAGWTKPDFADAPYQIFTIGTAPDTVKVAFIGVTTMETPMITVASATAGLCFKDPVDSIVHYHDQMKAEGADVIVVLSHLGYADGGYGYGIPVYGDQGLAMRLNSAGKPVNLIIGGHSHTDLTGATTVGTTKVVQAQYNGRKVGRADITVGIDGSIAITWGRNVINTTDPQDPTVQGVVTAYATDPNYTAAVNHPIGYVQVDLLRNYNGDSMMGDFIDDAIYNKLNSDADMTNDVDMFFHNPGNIRTSWCAVSAGVGGYIWSSTETDCNPGAWAHAPMVLSYGQMFTILPFGNQAIVGEMTGAAILDVLNQSASLFKGAIQPSGIRYSFYHYADALPGPQPYAWGACDVTVFNKTTMMWDPLDMNKSYKVGTSEFLAPAGQDGFSGFKYMTNITYWGDMLDAVNAYVAATYTVGNPYMGPNGDGTLDGRIGLNGDGDAVYDPGEIVPLTILHHNDSHGNLFKGTYVGYTQLATLIKQERLHNPNRTLLLSAGDNIQGDLMSYLFRTAPTGYMSDGTAIADTALHMSPLIKAFNSMGYDAMTLGNHEFNFGSSVFKSVLGQAAFPVLQANVTDPLNGYGLAAANIQPYVTKTIGPENINVAILGIGNHRVPYYELPTNIAGLTFSHPIAKAQELSVMLRPTNDVVIALTHIGFTENPLSPEVDNKVDTNLAAQTSGIDAVIGGHSHTDPSRQTAYSGNFKYLPSIVSDVDGKPVSVTQAYRYNNYLGEVMLGLRPRFGGGYEVVSRTGRYLAVTNSAPATAEDAATKAIIDPYVALLNTYTSIVIGSTTMPIDALLAFTQETNAANLQADAAVHELKTLRSIPVDFHLAGAMFNKQIAAGATPQSPYTLNISDMVNLMPYENSLVVISMNGPQIKEVLERAYRNYYYYKYVPGYGDYAHYTTCMLDIDSVGEITYNDLYPELPNGNNVMSLKINGVPVNFSDASKYYNVSTVNYLALGSCNFHNNGISIWPLNQITYDTQYYARDAAVHYILDSGTVSPAIEGRLKFDAGVYDVVRISGGIWNYYGNIQSGLFGVTAGDRILLRDTCDAGSVIFSPANGAAVSIEGGYDSGFVSSPGYTVVTKLTVEKGQLTVSGIAIQ